MDGWPPVLVECSPVPTLIPPFASRAARQEVKAKVHASSVALPQQPHTRIKIHGLDDGALASVEGLLAAAADKRRAKAAAAPHGGGYGSSGGASVNSRAASSAAGGASAAARMFASAMGRAGGGGTHRR